MRTYQITVNEEQAQVTAKALELYARIGLGQLDNLDLHPEIRRRMYQLPDGKTTAARSLLNEIAGVIFGFAQPGRQSHGIYSPEIMDTNRVAWDLNQVLRHRLAWDNKKECETAFGVNFHDPMQASTEVPLATIIEVKS